MKAIIFLPIIVALASATPLQQYKPGDRYIYFPDGDGQLHLVDLQPEEIPVAPRVDIGHLHFFLFTRINPSIGQELYLNDFDGLGRSHFDPRRPTKFLVHGWRSDANTAFNIDVTRSTLLYHDANVIVVDWYHYANNINYITAALSVSGVGVNVALFADYIISAGSALNSIQLVGFSLGGHVIGNAGRHVRHGKLPIVTSLDPAGPLFGPENNNRVQPTDAKEVEIVHSNGGALGNSDQLGTMDYYPNGGRSQPGCLLDSCSHDRAYQYYAESIGTRGFLARPCSSVSQAMEQTCSGNNQFYMGGGWSTKNWRGIYHLSTNWRSPFALH